MGKLLKYPVWFVSWLLRTVLGLGFTLANWVHSNQLGSLQLAYP